MTGRVGGTRRSLVGHVVGSLPPGSTNPSNTSASALPNSWPGNPASSTAATSSAHGSSTGAPALTTTTVLRIRGTRAERAHPGGRGATARCDRSPHSRPPRLSQRRARRRRPHERATPLVRSPPRRCRWASCSPSWRLIPTPRPADPTSYASTTSSSSPRSSQIWCTACGGIMRASITSASGGSSSSTSNTASPSTDRRHRPIPDPAIAYVPASIARMIVCTSTQASASS